MRSIQEERPFRSAAHPSLLCCLFFVLVFVVLLPQESYGFQSLPLSTTTTTTNRQQQQRDGGSSRLNAAIIDPVDIPAILTTAQHAADLPISSLFAVLTSTLDFSGGSIAPSVHAMAEMGLAQGTATAIPMAKAATTAAATIQDMIPSAGEAIQAQAQDALNGGWKVMDASKFVHGGDASFPGFSETKSILAPHLLPGSSDESVTMTSWPQGMFKARLSYASTMLRAFEKLPYVAFGYVLLEFFFLRSGVDVYKEDVEDDPSGVFAETVSDVGVRFAFLFVLAVITYVIA